MATDLGDDTRGSDRDAATDGCSAVPSRKAASSSTKRQPAMSSQPSLAIAAGADTNQEIERLLLDQKRVKEERKRVAQELKNAQRRRKRLKHRARLLSTEDLVRVMALREQESAAKAATEGVVLSAGSSSAAASSAACDNAEPVED